MTEDFAQDWPQIGDLVEHRANHEIGVVVNVGTTCANLDHVTGLSCCADRFRCHTRRSGIVTIEMCAGRREDVNTICIEPHRPPPDLKETVLR